MSKSIKLFLICHNKKNCIFRADLSSIKLEVLLEKSLIGSSTHIQMNPRGLVCASFASTLNSIFYIKKKMLDNVY